MPCGCDTGSLVKLSAYSSIHPPLHPPTHPPIHPSIYLSLHNIHIYFPPAITQGGKHYSSHFLMGKLRQERLPSPDPWGSLAAQGLSTGFPTCASHTTLVRLQRSCLLSCCHRIPFLPHHDFVLGMGCGVVATPPASLGEREKCNPRVWTWLHSPSNSGDNDPGLLSHGMVEVARDLWRSSGPSPAQAESPGVTPRAPSGIFRSPGMEGPQPRQPGPVLGHCPSKKKLFGDWASREQTDRQTW